MTNPTQKHAEAVQDALERQHQDRRSHTPDQQDAVEAAIEDAQRALKGAVSGNVPDGDLIGRAVVRPVSGANGQTILHTGQTVTTESVEQARREGLMHDLTAAVDNPPLRTKLSQPLGNAHEEVPE